MAHNKPTFELSDHAMSQPTPEVIELIKDIPIYQASIARNYFPILEKPEIARNFPNNWMTPQLASALERGDAEYVLSTGTNHDRMHIIRPPYFLLKSYYHLWSKHPDIAFTWSGQCPRISLTTVLATEHVARVNAAKRSSLSHQTPTLEDRRLDSRTLYINLQPDPHFWTQCDLERMLEEINIARASHPSGWYHLDCSSYYLAYLLKKITLWDLWKYFEHPASIIHAYEHTPKNIKKFLTSHFNCPVIDLFGSTELGYLYYSDRHGAYHPFLDQMSPELVPVSSNSATYSLIISSIRNPYMPLIRYRSGDCVQTCDNTADPLNIRRFCGREKELLKTTKGIFSQADVDDWLSDESPDIFTYQLHVSNSSQACMRYTSFDDAPLRPDVARSLRQRIHLASGLECALDHRLHIPPGKSGKYAWLVNHHEADARG